MGREQLGTVVGRSEQAVVRDSPRPRPDPPPGTGMAAEAGASSGLRQLWARGVGVWSNLSLARRAAVVAFVGQSLLATVLGYWISGRIQESVLLQAAQTSSLLLESLIGPHVQDLAHGPELSPAAAASLRELLLRPPLKSNVAELRIWRRDASIVFDSEGSSSHVAPPVADEIESAFNGRLRVELNDAHHDQGALERKHSMPLFEINAPVHETGTERVIAVAEFYQGAAQLHADLARARMQSWIGSALIAIALLLPLVPIIRGASRTIDNQKHEIEVRKLEQARLAEQNVALRGGIEQAHRRGAEINERSMRRIGADLHDGPAQLVGLALLKLDELIPPLKFSAGADRHLETLNLVRQALTDSLKEIRGIAAGLALPELERVTLATALELAVRSHEQRTRTRVNLNLGALPAHLPLPVTICLFRFAQEALNNAYRHAAGRGQMLTASVGSGVVKVEVRDTGPGFDVAQLGDRKDKLGLSGLKNRVESLGGQLEIRSVPGQGTVLIASFRNATNLAHD